MMEWRLLMELPDEDAEALRRTALECGTTVAGLVEGFILDLTGSPGSNGEEAEKLAGAWMDYKHGVADGESTFEAWLAGSSRHEGAVWACTSIDEADRRISRVMEETAGRYELVMGEKVPWYLCEDNHGHPFDTLDEWKAARQEEVLSLQDEVAKAWGYFRGLWDLYEGNGRPGRTDDVKAWSSGKAGTTEPASARRNGGGLDAFLTKKAADIARWDGNTNRGMALKSSVARRVPVRNWKRDGRYCTERELTVEMSNEAVVRLRGVAFGRGVTVPRLLESFVHDLVGSDMVLEDWKRCAMPDGFPCYLAEGGQLQKAVRSYDKMLSYEEWIYSLEDAIAYGADGDVPWTECEDQNGNRYESREAWNRDLQRDVETLWGKLADSWAFLNRQWDDYRMSSRVPPGKDSMMEELAKLSEASNKVAGELEPVEAIMVRKREKVQEKRKELSPSP